MIRGVWTQVTIPADTLKVGDLLNARSAQFPLVPDNVWYQLAEVAKITGDRVEFRIKGQRGSYGWHSLLAKSSPTPSKPHGVTWPLVTVMREDTYGARR